MRLFLGLALALAGQAPAQTDSSEPLQQVAEFAQILQSVAPKALAQETLEQRRLVPESGLRLRVGAAALAPRPMRTQTRTIVSEFTVAPLNSSQGGNLLEFRQVISVDGRSAQSPQEARHALSLGVRSADDQARKRMLENFARHGLDDLATDYSLILLAFTANGQRSLTIDATAREFVGADDCLVYSWRQTSPEGGALMFAGREAVREALSGRLWVRKADGLPLRISAEASHVSGKQTVRDEAVVDYVLSERGFVAPASVHHRHLIDGDVRTENLFSYGPFRLFAADSEIKFTTDGDPVEK